MQILHVLGQKVQFHPGFGCGGEEHFWMDSTLATANAMESVVGERKMKIVRVS